MDEHPGNEPNYFNDKYRIRTFNFVIKVVEFLRQIPGSQDLKYLRIN